MTNWMKWLLLGVLSAVLGLAVLGNTVIATMAVTTLTGAALLICGGFQIAGGFTSAASAGSRIFGILLGVLLGVLGLNFLFDPLAGAVSLTMLVLLLLALSGILRIAFAWQMRAGALFWPMLLSGALSILLAAYVLANFAAASMTFLGIMLGIELLLNGVGLIIFALALRRRHAQG